ncbi:COG2740 Predicted nucleic-acid-binding protein implicated in transcription termination [Candidatus Nanopelagicaceae bacterium]|jgi:predicted RNA-binding protein YlxR (DUF448 family)
MRSKQGSDTIKPLDLTLPVRSCIGCRKRANPSALIRVVLVDGKVIPDLKGGAAGRGAWLHKKCAEGAISRGAFVFAFKTNKAQTEAVDVSELQQYLLTNEWI